MKQTTSKASWRQNYSCLAWQIMVTNAHFTPIWVPKNVPQNIFLTIWPIFWVLTCYVILNMRQVGTQSWDVGLLSHYEFPASPTFDIFYSPSTIQERIGILTWDLVLKWDLESWDFGYSVKGPWDAHCTIQKLNLKKITSHLQQLYWMKVDACTVGIAQS